MDIDAEGKKQISEIADSSLTAFAVIASSAEEELSHPHSANVEVRNTFTVNPGAERSVEQHNSQRLETLQLLLSQPAIARVKARKTDGSLQTLFITRAAPPRVKLQNATLASYRAPIGAIAERRPGEAFDCSTPNGSITMEVIEVARLFPAHDVKGWDSRNTIVEGEAIRIITISSLREFLADVAPLEELDVLEALLAEDREKGVIIDGIRRNVITKMGLRDQPILDRIQGEIFRLPLDRRLLLIGAPGTGKTTTLIRRLGQKLESESLDDRKATLGIFQPTGSAQTELADVHTDRSAQAVCQRSLQPRAYSSAQ